MEVTLNPIHLNSLLHPDQKIIVCGNCKKAATPLFHFQDPKSADYHLDAEFCCRCPICKRRAVCENSSISTTVRICSKCQTTRRKPMIDRQIFKKNEYTLMVWDDKANRTFKDIAELCDFYKNEELPAVCYGVKEVIPAVSAEQVLSDAYQEHIIPSRFPQYTAVVETVLKGLFADSVRPRIWIKDPGIIIELHD
jgi:hypothetical protein